MFPLGVDVDKISFCIALNPEAYRATADITILKIFLAAGRAVDGGDKGFTAIGAADFGIFKQRAHW